MEAARIDYGVEGASARAAGRQRSILVGATSAAAALSVAAAMIHAYTMPQHFVEWWGYGVFFLINALAQGAGAVALIGWPRRSIFLVGVAGNLLILAMWAVSRTVGIPLFGPGAGRVESMDLPSVLCVTVEALSVLVLAALVVASWNPRETAGEA